MLVGKGWTDQLQDRRYLMLEGTDGRLHYVPLPPALERIVTARPPRIGDLVALTRSVSVHQGREFVQTKVEGIEIAQSIDGLIYRGRLVGYAHGQDKQRYAVVDIGRDEVLAFPARDATSRPGARCARPVTGLTTAGASSGGSPTQSLSDSGSGAGSGERVTAPAPVSSVRETAMSQGRRHVQTYIGVTDYARLQREAAARDATISKCAADCLREYFALRAELATALETTSAPGDPHHGAIIHSLLARSEERLVATFDRRSTEILRELRRVSSMLDRLVQLYLVHTPEVPQELRDGAIASANQRYASYQRAVSDRVAEADRAEARPVDADKDLTA